ncbi:MAG TPA: TetR family transcriptional regulator [Solirubrobacteraceae bacterium]|nr:TetR family transcriptional regulator [Solirubrobacteraceae bacterium]
MTRLSYPEAARALLRDSLLDSASDRLAERPWGEVTMADVARGAGVSRQTLYNEFGARDELALALILREGERLLSGVEQAVIAHREEPAEALRAAFELFLLAAEENPLIRTIATGDGSDGLLALVTTQGRPVLSFATDRLGGFLHESWPAVARADADAVAEIAVRLAISHAALPTGSAADTAAVVARALGPHLRALVDCA